MYFLGSSCIAIFSSLLYKDNGVDKRRVEMRGTRECECVRRRTRMTTNKRGNSAERRTCGNWRARVKTPPERVKGAAEKVGHYYLCFRRHHLLRTFLASFYRFLCALHDVLSCRWSQNSRKQQQQNTNSKTDMAVSKLLYFRKGWET